MLTRRQFLAAAIGAAIGDALRADVISWRADRFAEELSEASTVKALDPDRRPTERLNRSAVKTVLFNTPKTKARK